MRITFHDKSVGFHTVKRRKTIQLGFIGTGEIMSSIVTGLCSFGTTSHSTYLSPPNAAVASELFNRFKGPSKGISVASSNQEVVDHSDTIVIAVRPAGVRIALGQGRSTHEKLKSIILRVVEVRDGESWGKNLN